MKKNEGFPEKSASEQDLRRERPPSPPSEGSESENLSAGGQGNRPPVRSTEEMMRASVPMAAPPTPCPPPPRYRLVPARDNSGRVVVREPLTEYTHLSLVQQPPGWPGADSYSEFVARALSSSLTFTAPPNKRKGKLREPPERQPRCVTCGKIFGSWKALFGHLRSHHDLPHPGALPPPKASKVDPLIPNIRQQRELTLSLMNAATAVSTMVVQGAPEKAMQIGESSGGAGNSSEPPPFPSTRAPTVDLNNPDENRRSLRNDGLKLDLNAPPPDSDSEDE